MSGTDIKRIIPGNIYSALQNAENPSSTNPFATISDLPTGGGNLLLTGGASYSGTGLVFDISTLTYLISGVEYTSTPTTVTLAAGDASNSRFDAIVADENQTVSVIQGTPASTPLTPAIGQDQVLIQYILVGANATSPSIVTENVYLESNSGWTGKGVATGSTNTTADFSATSPTPFQGSECANLDIGRYSSGRGVFFSTGSPVSRADYVVMSLRVYLTEDLTNTDGFATTRRPIIRAWNDNIKSIYCGYAYLDQYGLDYSLLNQWQIVNVPTAIMQSNQATATTLGYLLLGLTGVNNNAQVAANIVIDDFKLQTGYGPSTNTATVDILNENTIIADTAKFNFLATKGTSNRIQEDTANNRVDIQINNPGTIAQTSVAATLNINVRNNSNAVLNAQAADFTIALPTGEPQDCQKLMIRIKDDGTARAITWNAVFKAVGITLPTTTVAGKFLYVGCVYNGTAVKWDVIALAQEA